MALFMLIVAVIFRLSLDWIEIQDQKAEIKRQQKREEEMIARKERVEEELSSYIYEYGA